MFLRIRNYNEMPLNLFTTNRYTVVKSVKLCFDLQIIGLLFCSRRVL